MWVPILMFELLRRNLANTNYVPLGLELLVVVLEEVAANASISKDQAIALPLALETASWRSFPQIDAFVYSELQSSGNLALIRSVSLRRSLANHYTSIRSYSRVGLDLDIQHQFDRLT
jgi:hypothetical protein